MALTPDEARDRARALTGYHDFGSAEFHEGLERICGAMPRMPLLPAVRDQLERKIIGDLANRLRIEAWYTEHPEVEDEVIEGVVLVCGLPRTGTTATVAMLALDERLRFLRAWEALQPLPPPDLVNEKVDPRRQAAIEGAKSYAMRAKHLNDPDGPEEDIALLSGLTMHSYNGHLPMPADYIDWWIRRDFTGHYRYLERVLKLLQSRRGPRTWLLKSPPHLFHLAAFARRFPDTRYVWTHRDPAKVLSSAASLQSGMQAERSEPDGIDLQACGRGLLRFWREGMDKALAARAAIGEDRFIDIDNAQVVARPLEVFERIYTHLRLPLGEALRARLAAYNADNAPGAFGAHRHAPEEYGLTRDEVRSVFADYVERFAV